MKALVTGGRGFVGSHLREQLGGYGLEAIPYDLKDGLDVLDYETLSTGIAHVDVVFDCAGVLGSAETMSHIRHALEVNVGGVLNILEACHKHNKPLVHLSLKNDWHNPYMISKHTAANFCLMYAEYMRLPVAIVRGLNAYGPGQHWGKVRKVVPTWIMAALQGKPIEIYGDGQQILDLIHVEDLCELMIRMWEERAWGEDVDGGTGVPTTAEYLAYTIRKLAGDKSHIEYIPMRPGEPPEGGIALADPSKALRLVGFYPDIALHVGLRETVDWYREHGHEVRDV